MLSRFEALGAFLRAHRPIWGPRPFEGLPVPWEADHPEVGAWLDALSPERLDGDWIAGAPPCVAGWAEAAAEVARCAPLPRGEAIEISVGARRRVPGRKVAQIEAFAATVRGAGLGTRPVLDWCAGKGHLGRALCRHTRASLLAIEWDEALCEQGRARCAHEGLDAEFACLDATSPEAAARLRDEHAVVALHACGDLHAALLRAVAERPVALLALAPCCYNKAGVKRGEPLSRAGAAMGLRLRPSDLDLIHREQVVARGRDRRRAWQSMAWRLGFDRLQRDLGGAGYRTMPSFPKAWLSLPFADFCERFAATDDLLLPAGLDSTPYEARGWALLDRVRARDAVRGLFRPALEQWLILDRAMVLVEAGLQVQVGTFCERSMTPRNTMILARR